MGILKKKFRNIKKFPRWIYWFPAFFLKVMFKIAYRVKIDDPDGVINSMTPRIGLTWHNRLLFFPCLPNSKVSKKTVAIVSASRDGQYISDLISHFGMRCSRGSSSRGGVNAQLGAIKELNNGNSVGITPDGPRGPVYKLKKGAIQLASVTGAPIIIISINASKYWQFKSWDRFQIPKPGAKITVIARGWFYIPPDLDAESVEKYRLDIEKRLTDITVD